MRYIAFIAVAFLLISSCAEADESMPTGDSWPEVQNAGQGSLIALYVPAEGFAYRDEDGELTGLTIDLLRGFSDYLAEVHQIQLDLHFIEEENWSRFYRMVAEGEDGMIGMGNVTITEERRQELTFSPPYMTNIAALVTHKDVPELNQLENIGTVFEGRDALAFEGTLHEERLRTLTEHYYPEADIHMAHSNDEIIERLGEQDRYFAYIDIYNFWRAAERGLPLKRHETGDESAEQFGYIMPMQTSWDEILNEYFEYNGGLLQSDEYRTVMTRHLGEHLTDLLMEAQRYN